MTEALIRTPGFFIIKAAGDNSGCAWPDPVTGGIPQGPEVSLFVAHNAEFWTAEAAYAEAQRLAQATPGNRYYVVQQIGGAMAHAPRVEAYLDAP